MLWQRVLKEKKELDDKIESLRYYRDSEPFKKVDASEQERLIDLAFSIICSIIGLVVMVGWVIVLAFIFYGSEDDLN